MDPSCTSEAKPFVDSKGLPRTGGAQKALSRAGEQMCTKIPRNLLSMKELLVSPKFHLCTIVHKLTQKWSFRAH
jgi:hypothetical protein